jgi:hypothetical protein
MNPCTHYRVMRDSGLTRPGAVFVVLVMVLAWPFTALAEWATPEKKGFGKFREWGRERIVDINLLAECGHVTDLTDSRFFKQPLDTAADIWWREEMQVLQRLKGREEYLKTIACVRKAEAERKLNALICACVVSVVGGFAVALYAIKYLK